MTVTSKNKMTHLQQPVQPDHATGRPRGGRPTLVLPAQHRLHQPGVRDLRGRPGASVGPPPRSRSVAGPNVITSLASLAGATGVSPSLALAWFVLDTFT